MALHTFRHALPGDIEEIVSLEYDLFPDNNFNERTLLHHLSSGFCNFMDVDGKTAGYVMCSKADAPLIDVLRLGVRTQYRGVGIASVLLGSVLRLGKETMLTVQKENVPAIRLYQKHGFKIAGTMPQHASWVMVRRTSS